MKNISKQEVIDGYKNILIDIEKNNIEALNLGFVQSNCKPMLYTILIHCVENIDIFNNAQLNNIYNFINRLGYGN